MAGAVQVSPEGVEAETWKLTAPVNPPIDKTEIGVVALAPARGIAGVIRPADIEKSCATATLYVITAVEWDSAPLAPVTATVNVPAVIEWQDRVVVVLVGMVTDAMGLQSRPSSGLAVKATFPVKPFPGVIVIVAVQLFPTTHVTVVGLAEMSKSGEGTDMVIVAVWVKAPLVPVTFTK